MISARHTTNRQSIKKWHVPLRKSVTIQLLTSRYNALALRKYDLRGVTAQKVFFKKGKEKFMKCCIFPQSVQYISSLTNYRSSEHLLFLGTLMEVYGSGYFCLFACMQSLLPPRHINMQSKSVISSISVETIDTMSSCNPIKMCSRASIRS